MNSIFCVHEHVSIYRTWETATSGTSSDGPLDKILLVLAWGISFGFSITQEDDALM